MFPPTSLDTSSASDGLSWEEMYFSPCAPSTEAADMAFSSWPELEPCPKIQSSYDETNSAFSKETAVILSDQNLSESIKNEKTIHADIHISSHDTDNSENTFKYSVEDLASRALSLTRSHYAEDKDECYLDRAAEQNPHKTESTPMRFPTRRQRRPASSCARLGIPNHYRPSSEAVSSISLI